MQGLMKGIKSVGDMVMPLMATSQFAESGVLTHEEFVQAGDQLVFQCPTWQWSAASKGMGVDYLPANKQFLITRNVPSLRRAHTYALADAKEELVGGGAADGEGWLSTHSEADMERNREVADIDDEQIKSGTSRSGAAASSAAASSKAATASAAAADESDEVGDIDDIDGDISNLVVSAKPAAAAAAAAPAQPSAAAAAAEEFPDMEAFDHDDNVLAAPQYLKAEEPEDNLVKTRTYDLSIVYDKWYRTPRVYLFGYDEHRQPLTPNQIMEDISADHANKTVTVENHPFLGIPHASIHPCKHAHLMKRIVDQMQANASTGDAKQQVDVRQYMTIFLKFMSSVMPTIDYDLTSSASASDLFKFTMNEPKAGSK